MKYDIPEQLEAKEITADDPAKRAKGILMRTRATKDQVSAQHGQHEMEETSATVD